MTKHAYGWHNLPAIFLCQPSTFSFYQHAQQRNIGFVSLNMRHYKKAPHHSIILVIYKRKMLFLFVPFPFVRYSTALSGTNTIIFYSFHLLGLVFYDWYKQNKCQNKTNRNPLFK